MERIRCLPFFPAGHLIARHLQQPYPWRHLFKFGLANQTSVCSMSFEISPFLIDIFGLLRYLTSVLKKWEAKFEYALFLIISMMAVMVSFGLRLGKNNNPLNCFKTIPGSFYRVRNSRSQSKNLQHKLTLHAYTLHFYIRYDDAVTLETSAPPF